jgi:hypothetical protein
LASTAGSIIAGSSRGCWSVRPAGAYPSRSPRCVWPSPARSGQVRPAIVAHIADLLANCPAETITVPGLTRVPVLDAVRETYPALDWPALHAVTTTLTRTSLLVTTDPARYNGIPVDVIDL